MTADHFVDLSSNNPYPNLAAYAKAGHAHVCRKVSEGVGYRWHEGDAIPPAAHALGMHVGNYHWLRPDASATAQAAFFVAAVKPTLAPGDWLMTDFEATYSNGQRISDGSDVARAAQLEEFNAYVKAHLPTFPLYVYTGNWYLQQMGPHCQAVARKFPIVMSDYSGVGTLPNPYQLNYVAWQFTDHATVPGLSAPVDYNRWLITPSTTQGDDMNADQDARLKRVEAAVAEIQSYFVDEGYHRTISSILLRRLRGSHYTNTRKLK